MLNFTDNAAEYAHGREKAGAETRRAVPSWLVKAAAVLFIIAAPFIAAALLSMLSNKEPEVARYSLSSAKLVSPVRIVMISDLHRNELDEDNQKLIDMTALESPDLIFVNGDMLEPDYTEREEAAFKSLLERLNGIAPTFFSAGNHDYPAYFYLYELAENELLRGLELSPLVRRLESTGARFLERSYADIEINSNALRIGGLYAFTYKNEVYTEKQFEAIGSFLSEFTDGERFSILLSHRPEGFEYSDEADIGGIDLVLSGHTHNGVVALPFGLGALWSMGRSFPEFDRGSFSVNGTELIIGAGLDGYKGFIPRVFNPPEIVTVELLPKAP